MGGSYGSIHVRTNDQQRVVAALELLSCEGTKRFLISPAIKGWVAVFPDNNGQDETLGKALASTLGNATVIQCLVHDDDLFAYWFFENGKLVDQYNSNPGYFGEDNTDRGGNARAFSRLLHNEKKIEDLQALLDAERFTFELERQDQFAALLGLSNTDHAYDYLQSGETDGVRRWKQFIHVPDPAVEKAAGRAAAAAIQAELKELKRQGALFVDELAKKSLNKRFYKYLSWGIDPATSSVVSAWLNGFSENHESAQTEWRQFSAPHWKANDWKPPTALEFFEFSPSGRLLINRVPGRSSIEIWDRREMRVVMEPEFSSGQMLGFVCSRDDSRVLVTVQTRDHFQLHVLNLTGTRSNTILSLKQHVLRIALHPDGRWLALGGHTLGLLDLARPNEIRLFGIGGLSDDDVPVTDFQTSAVIRGTIERTLPEELNRPDSELSQDEIERKYFPERFPSPTAIEDQREMTRYRSGEFLGPLKFTPDGKWLICATNEGVRVFSWPTLRTTTEASPTPDFSAEAGQMPARPEDPVQYTGRWTYALDYDPARQRVLFGGLEGKVKYLDLTSGKSGALPAGPERTVVDRLSLTPDRTAMVVTRHPMNLPNVPEPGRFQIWNYQALCAAAGIPY